MTIVEIPSNAITHQATVVAVEGRALLIEGEPGMGKSSLALALVDRGAVLVGDDGVLLANVGGRLWAYPHPRTRGLIEIRNLGIVNTPSAPAPVVLCVALSTDAPRHIDQANERIICGVSMPALTLWPNSPVLALRAEWALKLHGLSVGAAIGDSGRP